MVINGTTEKMILWAIPLNCIGLSNLTIQSSLAGTIKTPDLYGKGPPLIKKRPEICKKLQTI
jgi:hypothetical protein